MKPFLTLCLCGALAACGSPAPPPPPVQTQPASTPPPSPVVKPSVKPSPSQPPKPLTLEQKAEKFRLQFYKEVEKRGTGFKTKYAVTTMQKWEEQPNGVELGFENTCAELKENSDAQAVAQSAFDVNGGSIPLDQLEIWYGAKFAAAKAIGCAK